MNADESVLSQVSERIIGGAFTVANTLGSGFLEKVYENALAHELRSRGLPVAQQQGVVVCYNGIVVGEYTADLVVDGSVIVELKVVSALDNVHRAQ